MMDRNDRLRNVLGVIVLIVLAAVLGALISGSALLTIWVLNTLFTTEIAYTWRTEFAAFLFNLFAAWIGVGPWLFVGFRRGE